MSMLSPEKITPQQNPAETKIKIIDTREQMIAAIMTLQEATESAISLTDTTTLTSLRNNPESASASKVHIVFDPESPNLNFLDLLRTLSNLEVTYGGKIISLLEYLNELQVFQHLDASNQLKPVQLSIKDKTAQHTILGNQTAELKLLRPNLYTLNYLILCTNKLWQALQAVCEADKIVVKKPEQVRDYVLNNSPVETSLPWYSPIITTPSKPEARIEAIHFGFIQNFLKQMAADINQPMYSPLYVLTVTPLEQLKTDSAATIVHVSVPLVRAGQLLNTLEPFLKSATGSESVYHIQDDTAKGQLKLFKIINDYLISINILFSISNVVDRDLLAVTTYIRTYYSRASSIVITTQNNTKIHPIDLTETIRIKLNLVQGS